MPRFSHNTEKYLEGNNPKTISPNSVRHAPRAADVNVKKRIYANGIGRLPNHSAIRGEWRMSGMHREYANANSEQTIHDSSIDARTTT